MLLAPPGQHETTSKAHITHSRMLRLLPTLLLLLLLPSLLLLLLLLPSPMMPTTTGPLAPEARGALHLLGAAAGSSHEPAATPMHWNTGALQNDRTRSPRMPPHEICRR